MKKVFYTLIMCFMFAGINAQIVEPYGGGIVSENSVQTPIDIKEVGRSIHVASVEEGTLMVRRFYRGKWQNFGDTQLTGIKNLKDIRIFAYKAVPYVFCFYDGKMSVVRAIDDVWEFVGETSFGEGSIDNPEFSVIGEVPYIVYEDKDYEVIRMISLLDDSWYDVDLISNVGILDYKLAPNMRGDLFLALLSAEGIMIRDVDQKTEEVTDWKELSKMIKLDNVTAIDDFEFVENDAYLTYSNEQGSPVIIRLKDLEKKWEQLEELKESITMTRKNYNLNISEYYFFVSLSKDGKPQYLKNNKKEVWGDVTDIDTKKAKSVASCEYRNIIYVAYVDNATSKVMVRKIEKGELDEE